MKVLQFVADGSPGGGTTHVLQLLGGLQDRCRPALVTQAGSSLHSDAERLGIRVFAGDFFRSRLDPRAARTIARAVARYQPDVVHCHGGRAAFFRGWHIDTVPTIYTVHGFHHDRKRFLARRSGQLAERRNLRRAHHVIFVSRYDRRLAQRHRLLPTATPHTVIYNGIRLPTVAPTGPARSGGVGFVGRFVPQKHPELFLDVLERLPGRRGVMVGGGVLQPQIAARAGRRGLGDRLELLGPRTRTQTLELLRTLSVLVMTSRWEGLPILALEAMWLGVPVISTAVGGMPEIIEHRLTGLLAADGAADELADGVVELERNQPLRDSIVQAAGRRVQSVFAEEAMLDNIADIYRRVTHDKQTPRTKQVTP